MVNRNPTTMVNGNPIRMVKLNSHFEATLVGYKKLYRSRNDTRKNVQKDSKLQATRVLQNGNYNCAGKGSQDCGQVLRLG
jgi:hypothetical protein